MRILRVCSFPPGYSLSPSLRDASAIFEHCGSEMRLQTKFRHLLILEPVALSVLFLVVTMSAGSAAYAQGFSGLAGMKTTITLDRKLPAMLKLPGNAIDIRPSP